MHSSGKSDAPLRATNMNRVIVHTALFAAIVSAASTQTGAIEPASSLLRADWYTNAITADDARQRERADRQYYSRQYENQQYENRQYNNRLYNQEYQNRQYYNRLYYNRQYYNRPR